MTPTDKPRCHTSNTQPAGQNGSANRIAEEAESGLSEELQLDLLRLTHELELAQAELKVQNEELRSISRELEASRLEYWELYESAPVAFVTIGKRGLIEKANAAARQMLTGPGDRLVGKAFSNHVAPDDRNTYCRHMEQVAAAGANGSVQQLKFVSGRGTVIHVYCQVSCRFDADRRFSHWQLAFFDVTETKKLEDDLRVSREYLELATEAGEIGIWIGERNTGKTHWNDQLYRMLGLEPREGPEEMNYFFEFIHPEDRRGALEGIHSVTARGRGIDLEFRIIRADDGRVRWLKSRGIIDRDAAGQPTRIRGVNYDITDRRDAQEKLHAAQLMLSTQLAETERVNEELSQYAYAVSHDLKSPLRAIRNYADFIYEDLAATLTGDQKKYLEGLRKAVDQGDRLVNDLLSHSRIGRTALEKEEIDVPDLVSEIRAILDLQEGDAEFVLPREWAAFRADRTLVKQILQNLIANAVKFNERTPKRIEIGCRPAPENCVELFVRDNGIGIEPEYREQIFRIFQRLHSQKKYEGTGIGLAIVRKAAQTLGGSVRLESEPGRGSTFYVRLPLEAEKGPSPKRNRVGLDV